MMKVNISEAKSGRGETVPFEFHVTAEELDVVSEGIRLDDIVVRGEMLNTGTFFRASGEISCSRTFACDRCLELSTEHPVYEYSEEYRPAEEDVEDGPENCFHGDVIDITDMIRDTLLAAQPLHNVCRSDCKGLCPVCGANLNQGECGCNRLVVDPRLAALQEWTK